MSSFLKVKAIVIILFILIILLRLKPLSFCYSSYKQRTFLFHELNEAKTQRVTEKRKSRGGKGASLYVTGSKH